jgi:hypothetical protein
MPQQTLVHVMIVKDDVSAAQALQTALGNETWITGPGANQENGGMPHG